MRNLLYLSECVVFPSARQLPFYRINSNYFFTIKIICLLNISMLNRYIHNIPTYRADGCFLTKS